MANTLITPQALTNEALVVLHQKLNFIGSINRSYDDSYAQSGAKIGDTLKIRQPNQFTVRTGATLAAQDVTETSTSLTINKQAGVDMNFSSAELTLSLDKFSERYIQPAMSVLAASMEADALSMYKDVYQQVNNQGLAASFGKILQGRKILVDALTPSGDRTVCLNTQDNVDMITDTKGLFNPQEGLAKNFREGYLGRTAGFDFNENTILPSHPRGDAAGYVCNTSTGITSGTGTITLSTGTGTIAKGDVFTIAGVFRVHPETKQGTGQLQQFVATADSTTSVPVYPVPVTSGAKQNVTIVGAGASKAVTVAGTASAAHGISLGYHKDAFAFATADLVMPSGVDFSARKVLDGISIRIVRQYDINGDKFPCRLDVLYGWKTIRPELAVRFANN
jgi:hypothetical protein